MPEKVIISTLHQVPRYCVSEHKGLVWTSTARSRSFAHDLIAVTKSLAGGESHAYRHMMNEARKDIVHGLAEQARLLGANAVLGVQMNSTQILPATIDIYAYGTAVVLEKERRK
ncbi:MAG: YbjQ family protein [Candidatus Micrarchaeota archaeon]